MVGLMVHIKFRLQVGRYDWVNGSYIQYRLQVGRYD